MPSVPEQSYSNHTQYVPAFHFVLIPVLLLTLIGSIVNLVHSMGNHERLYSASLLVVLSFCGLLGAFMGRISALKAQDRAIRAEEALRHFVLTGKPLDPRLTVRQIIALRFASDAEFPGLANQAASGSLEPKAIKQAVKTWKADTYRV